MDLGQVMDLPALNSFFETPDRAKPQTRDLKAFLQQRTSKRPLVLVTHQVNITELTDVYPASGEMVFVRGDANGGFDVVGRAQGDQ